MRILGARPRCEAEREVIVLFLFSAVTCESGQILSPDFPGNSDSLIPFGLEQQGIPSVRYQQVYNASDFSSIAMSGAFITELRFSSDSQMGRTFTATLPDVQINLSTTTKGA